MQKFNQYRAWAGDRKATHQMTYRKPVIWQQCKSCRQQFDTNTMTFVENECSHCQAKKA
jgi:Zn finger protein HypA/HybF involved in hydrogenase expression